VKRIRTFSEAFRKEKVKMLEQGDITPTELSINTRIVSKQLTQKKLPCSHKGENKAANAYRISVDL